MDLTPTDLRFIKLIAPGHEREVVSVLNKRPFRLDVMGSATARSRRRDLSAWARLLLQVMRSPMRKPTTSGSGSIVWEREQSMAAERTSYVTRFGAPLPVSVVSTASPVVATPGFMRSLALVLRVLPLVLAADAASVLAASYVAILRNCLVLTSHARAAASGTDVFLFRIYRVETPFLAGALAGLGIRTTLIAGTTPMYPNVLHVYGDRLVLGTDYQAAEVAFYGQRWEWPQTVLWGPAEAVQLEEQYPTRQLPDLPDVIGVYSQGWWLRAKIGSADPETQEDYLNHERVFFSAMREYLDDRDQVRAVVFPHPLERRRWASHHEHGYGDLAEHPRVEIDWEGGSSILSFDRVGLGVTTFSTVGFDRIWMGARTVFFPESGSVDLELPSPYAKLFALDEVSLLDLVDRIRPLTNDQFLAEYFGTSSPAETSA